MNWRIQAMGLRFRKNIKIASGIRLNVGSKSAGLSFGVKGYGTVLIQEPAGGLPRACQGQDFYIRNLLAPEGNIKARLIKNEMNLCVCRRHGETLSNNNKRFMRSRCLRAS
ncbi:DUF4236 domain-containing protein [Paenibacillus yonginensis]|uniref:DUF4236 domain-containing protein n=1 Tax=Paenibacillus yonginensis TaxID=1462996 RepID=UPI0009F31F28